MNILLLGSGGREDALAWRLRQSPSCGRLLAAPGNPGIARWAECVAHRPVRSARSCRVGARRGHRPGRHRPRSAARRGRRRCAARGGNRRVRAERRRGPARRIERLHQGSVPRERHSDRGLCARRAGERGRAALDRFGLPVVIKADGLAAGKGVTVATTPRRSRGCDRCGWRRPAGDRGVPRRARKRACSRSSTATTAVPLASAQDHKRVGEGDTGPNTGGMGAYAPAPVLTRRAGAARDGRNRAADGARACRCRNAVQRRALCGADADRRRTQADRI